MIDMPTVNSIRIRKARGDSVAEIARDLGVSEPTVRKYVNKKDFSPKIPVVKSKPSILDPYKDAINAMLDEDAHTWHKQHHTAAKIFQRLQEEHGYEGGYTTVQQYVKQCKAERKVAKDQYLDLDWPPGEAQVDFGQADMYIRGILTREHFLTISFPYSNVGLAQVFHGENAECVCQGLQDIFNYIKGVPTRLVFDNATGIGRKMCGAIRTSELFGNFACHYGFEYAFCNPDSGNEKGSVENKVGAVRRDLFVPVPRFENIARYNNRLFERCMERSNKNHYSKNEPEIQLFIEDRVAMMPLPENPFNVVTYQHMKTDKYGKVCLEGNHRYSSDPSLGSSTVIVGKAAFEIYIYTTEGELIATHERAYGQAPSDSSDPAAQLALLCFKQNGWHNSRVRSSMPDSLRDAMDNMEKAERGVALRTLRNVATESGYANAIDAAATAIETLGHMDESSVEILAKAALDSRIPIAYDQEVGLSDYDIAFEMNGGVCNGKA